MLPPGVAWGAGMASRFSGALGSLGRGIGKYSGLIGIGMMGYGIAGPTSNDRGFFQRTGGAMWGGLKGSLGGLAIGGGIGAGVLGMRTGFSRPAMLGGAFAGAVIGGNLLGGFGAFKGGLSGNRPVNGIRGLHQ